MIQLRILGSTDLRGSDGRALLSVLAQPKRLTLLAYLAMNATGTFLRRDKLLALFWPDADSDHGRASLRRALYFLRQSLGDGVVVSRTDEEIGIESGSLECDAVAFAAANERGDAEVAFGLYGGALLDGLHVTGAAALEQWIELERRRLHRQAVEAAFTLCDDRIARGATREALGWARQGLALDPHSEPGVRRLIGLQAQLGERRAAVRSYEEFVARLSEELDLAPSAETRALGDTVRAVEEAPSEAGESSTVASEPLSQVTVSIPAPRSPAGEPSHIAARTLHSAAQRPVATAMVGLAGIIVVAALWGGLQTEPDEPAVARYSVVFPAGEQIAGRPGGRFAVSPDGSLLVYTGGPTGQLHVRRRGELRARPLRGTDRAVAPFFSPDGQRLGYFSRGRLVTRAVEGGPAVALGADFDPLDGAGWGPDGAIYAAGPGFDPLVRVAAAGGTGPEPFTTLDSVAGESWHRWPDALPNGRGVLFTAGFAALAGSTSWVAVADARTGEHALLVEGSYGRYSPSGHVVYATADRRLMAAPFDPVALELTGPPRAVGGDLRVGARGRVEFAISAPGTLIYATGPGLETRDLAWVTRDGVASAVDPAWQANFSYPTLSPDGSRFAVVVNEPSGADIWIQELEGGARFKLTVEGGVNGYPAWTPDGASITYFRNASETVELWTRRADGSGPPVLELSRPLDLAESLWSPDGEWLIYRTSNVPRGTSPGAADIVAVRPGGEAESVAVATTPYPEVAPALSPDGRWLAYASHESGREEIYVVPFPDVDRARWSVTPEGGMEPVWSRSGEELFYRDPSGRLVAIEIETSPTFSVGRSTTLFDARPYVLSGLHAMYSVAPDDQRFLMVRAGEADPGELIVVENWFQELRDGAGSL